MYRQCILLTALLDSPHPYFSFLVFTLCHLMTNDTTHLSYTKYIFLTCQQCLLQNNMGGKSLLPTNINRLLNLFPLCFLTLFSLDT